MLKAAAHLQKAVVATLFYRAVLLLTSQVKEGAGNHRDVLCCTTQFWEARIMVSLLEKRD